LRYKKVKNKERVRKMEPHEYLLRHSQKLSEEYPRKYLAIVDDTVVAVCGSGHDAFKKRKNHTQERRFI
jgi:hypothetical protein